MKPLSISLSFFALIFIVGFITNWIRHWPSNLTKGTQHIVIIGLILQGCFLGVAIVFLIKSLISN